MAILPVALCAGLVAAAPAQATITSITASHPTATEGVSFNGTLATFITNDALDSFTQHIDWGDGTSDSGPASISGDNGTVSGTHTYNEDGTYTVHVIVTESGGSPSTSSVDVTLTVSDGDLSIVAEAPTTISEGTQFAGPVAEVVDSGSPDTASNFTATINWGDGTTAVGTVSGAGGHFTVSGSHTYTDELPHGLITVTVSEPDAGTTVGPVDDHITVTEADALTAQPMTFAARDGTPFSGAVATFSDFATTTLPSDFTATISWGDGTSTTGTVSRSGGALTVAGEHTYHSPPASYPVSVTLADGSPGTASATATSTATVGPGQPSAVTGGANSVKINRATLTGIVDPNGGLTTYSFQFGASTAYGSTTPAGEAGLGTSGLAFSASLSGLRPGETYHYRVVATNAQGTTVGADRTFRTAALVLSVRSRRDDSFVVVVNAPGPGTFDLTLTRGNSVLGRARVRANRARHLRVLLRLNQAGVLLVSRHPHHFALSLKVTFRPPHAPRTGVTLSGLHLPRG